jgi:hypothetical protein
LPDRLQDAPLVRPLRDTGLTSGVSLIGLVPNLGANKIGGRRLHLSVAAVAHTNPCPLWGRVSSEVQLFGREGASHRGSSCARSSLPPRTCSLPPSHHKAWKPPRPELTLSAMEALRSDVKQAAMKGVGTLTSPASRAHGGWSHAQILPPHRRPWRSLVAHEARHP